MSVTPCSPRSASRIRPLLAATLLAGALAAPVAAQRRTPAAPDAPIEAQPYRFEFLGPATGGRFASIAGVEGDTSIWYAGSASGGIWKTTNGGANWRPIFDAQAVQAVGALAVAPSDRNTVWAGTGEAWAIRESDVMGDGVYKSTDAGATWQHMGLRETGRIARILVHPTDANVVYVCALGRTTGPQQERGVYKTTDGGKTWTRSVFVDVHTGCSDIAMDAKDPNVLVVGMWQVEMKPWGVTSGGPGSGIWMTHDGGGSWKKVEHAGLPKQPIGKVGVAIAPSNPKRMFALIQTYDQGSLWRSDDGGTSWQVVSWQRSLIGRAGYYLHLAVNSGNQDEVYVANSSFWRSMDGGKTFEDTRWGGDTHDIWISPSNPDHFGLTDDVGFTITTSHMRQRRRVVLNNGQMYHVAVDQRIPYWVYSNRQDNGTMRGPSDGYERGTPGMGPTGPLFYGMSAEGIRDWEHGIGGCESGFTTPDPNDHDVIWATCYGNKVTRYNHKTGTARSVQPYRITLDSPPDDLKYRCHWTAPLAIDPFDTKTVYYGCQVIFRTRNEGQSWEIISPDLSTQDPAKIKPSGGVIGDNLGQFYGEVVFAIAPSRVERGLIWAGTNDGKVWITRNGGADWTDLTKNVSGMPAWGTIRKIEPSPHDAATAYMVVDLHTNDDRRPYLYKTSDYGRTWKSVVGNLPATHPLDYVLSVAEHPDRRGMLLAGTGHAFYYSMDDGAHWTQFQSGLPAAPVTWIEIPKGWNDAVVSTYGRGLWILRDIGALQEGGVVAGGTTLFAPHNGVRRAREGRADLTFRVADTSQVTLEISDATGAVARRMTVRPRAGINRVVWNLRYDQAVAVALRTVAPDNPYIWDEPPYKGKDTRPIAHWGIQQPQTQGPLGAPGRYTVKLVAGGQTYTQALAVLKSTEIPASEADLVESTIAQVRVRDRLTETAEIVNRIEVLRKNIEDQLKSNAANAEAVKALKEMDKKLLDVELILLSRHDLHSDDKWFVETYRTYLSLLWLAGEIGSGAGDVAGGADSRPTDSSMQTLKELEGDLARAKAAFQVLMEKELPAFNARMSALLKPIA
ncbi:MAG: WD40/YVTN/BNR-like repeat-containing protein [Gemmatimonadota bacterium]